ncbi:hypothetical protein [Photobacterium angustum]|uniref:hypothetical protein n=1 Tax=Photobacterium angustum TaxID=661 RepID=UPI000AB68278|nr:hypothetical protein [Photobacterium angustum]
MSYKAESIDKPIENSRALGVLKTFTDSKNKIKSIAEKYAIDGEINNTQERTLKERLQVRLQKKTTTRTIKFRADYKTSLQPM